MLGGVAQKTLIAAATIKKYTDFGVDVDRWVKFRARRRRNCSHFSRSCHLQTRWWLILLKRSVRRFVILRRTCTATKSGRLSGAILSLDDTTLAVSGWCVLPT